MKKCSGASSKPRTSARSIGLTIACAVTSAVLLVSGGVALLLTPWASVSQASQAELPAALKFHKPAAVPSTNLQGQALLDAVRATYPINRFQCGNWMDGYAKLHKNILSGKAPPRFAVLRSKSAFGNGLADRLATSVSVLLFAILTDRAFMYDWDPIPSPHENLTLLHQQCGTMPFKEPGTPLWKAMRSDYIDWQYKPLDSGLTTLTMEHNCDVNVTGFKALWRKENLTAVGDGMASVVWHADHAGVYAAFKNPFLAAKLAALGLERDTAFSCLFDYIYRPVPEVVHMFHQELNVLLNPGVLKIGVQVRVGDWQLVDSYSFKPQQYPYLFRHYFECAAEIEKALAKPGQPVVWYTLVDIPSLRWGLANRYPDRLLINLDVVVEHIVKSKHTSDHSFFQAVGELWVFSYTSQHIITKISGFGKVPGMINANIGPGMPNSTAHFYTITHPMNFFNLVGLNNRKNLALWKPRKCGPAFADDIEVVTSDFTGI